jgi:hypothetical protein
VSQLSCTQTVRFVRNIWPILAFDDTEISKYHTGNICCTHCLVVLLKINMSSSRFSLSGRKCLVTGGTRGIGRAIAQELAGLGAEV